MLLESYILSCYHADAMQTLTAVLDLSPTSSRQVARPALVACNAPSRAVRANFIHRRLYHQISSPKKLQSSTGRGPRPAASQLISASPSKSFAIY